MVYLPTGCMTVMVALLFGGAFAAPVPTLKTGSDLRVPAMQLHPGNMEGVLPRDADIYVRGLSSSKKKNDPLIQECDDGVVATRKARGAWRNVAHHASGDDSFMASVTANRHNREGGILKEHIDAHGSVWPWRRPDRKYTSGCAKTITEEANKSTPEAMEQLARLGVFDQARKQKENASPKKSGPRIRWAV